MRIKYTWSRRQLINSDLTRTLGSNRNVLFLGWDGGYTSIYIFIKVLNVYISFIVCNYTSVKFLLFSASQNFIPNFSLTYSLFCSSETQMTLGVKENEDSSYKPIFSSLPETNILNVVKVGKKLFCMSLAQSWNHLVFCLAIFKQNHWCFTMAFLVSEIPQQQSLY